MESSINKLAKQKYSSVLKQLVSQKRLKQKLISISKFNVLLQCKFDIYTAKYISDIVDYSLKLPQKLKYGNVIKELKCRILFFYYVYNIGPYYEHQQLVYNKIIKLLLIKSNKFDIIYQEAIIDFNNKLDNFDEYCDMGYIFNIIYPEFIKQNKYYIKYLEY